MNILSRDKQIDIIAALCEGVGQRAVSRLTDTDRKTVARLALSVGRGAAELHDRMMVGLNVPRIECDELWQYIGCKQKNVKREDRAIRGDQYTFIALAASAKAILAYRTGKRDGATTDLFIRDLRERIIGAPEISTDGYYPYQPVIKYAFAGRVHHGVINKTYAVTDLRKDAAHRYSPAAVVAVERRAATGQPEEISTSYAERSNLSLRMASRRFTRLTNGFSKNIDCHIAAVALYVAYYNLCRPHESLTPNAKHQTTPAMALGVTDHVWSIGELIDAALKVAPPKPTPPTTPEQRRRQFRVIQGDLFD